MLRYYLKLPLYFVFSYFQNVSYFFLNQNVIIGYVPIIWNYSLYIYYIFKILPENIRFRLHPHSGVYGSRFTSSFKGIAGSTRSKSPLRRLFFVLQCSLLQQVTILKLNYKMFDIEIYKYITDQFSAMD